MTSPDEDLANIASAVVSATINPTVRERLKIALLRRISAGKVSVAVRFQLLGEGADDFLDTEIEGAGDTLRTRLANAISTRSDEIEEPVLIGYQLGIVLRSLQK
jgi:hypothetical protein